MRVRYSANATYLNTNFPLILIGFTFLMVVFYIPVGSILHRSAEHDRTGDG
jgi:hypothetical protein